MKLYTLKEQNSDFKNFILFWKQFYFNKNTRQYKKYIYKQKINKEELELFSKWRNNSENLNQAKQAQWQQVEKKLELLNNFKQQEKINLKKFRDEFRFLRPRWLIYLLHWCDPKKYPSFDQYTFTAQRFAQFQALDTLPFKDSTIEDFYFNHYLPDFYRKIDKDNLSSLQIYEGLNSFGKFLINLFGLTRE